jgi:CelD/BcsL family acetyltransferase involved in cellulose biosynthesis
MRTRERCNIMNGRMVHVRSLSPDDEAAWTALAARAAEPNPLYEPNCLVPASRHQTFGDEIHVVFAEEDGRIYGCMPVRRVRHWRNFAYPFVVTQVRRMIYCGTPLVDAERGDEAVDAMFDALRADRKLTKGRVLVLQELAQDGPVDASVQSAVERRHLPIYRYESWERGIVNRREEADYEGLQSRRDRKELRRCRRRLGELLGSEPVAVDRSADPAAIDEFIALEAAGYKGDAHVAMATVAGEADYFREMCARFAADGRLRVFCLEAGGQTLAMQILVTGGAGIFGMKISYDEQFAKYAPGVLLHFDSMKACHETTDARWIDTCSSPQFEVLMRIYPDRRRITSYFVPLGRNPIDRLAVKAFMALRPLHKKLHDKRAGTRHPDPAKGADPAKVPDATPRSEVVTVEPEPSVAPTLVLVGHQAPTIPSAPSESTSPESSSSDLVTATG